MSTARQRFGRYRLLRLALGALLTLAAAGTADSFRSEPNAALQLMGIGWASAPELSSRFVLATAPDVPADATERYRTLARHLARATGKEIVYQSSRDWPSYQQELRTGGYDLVINSAPIASWLIANRAHEPLVRASAQDRFVLITDNTHAITQVSELAGRRICAPALPAVGTLSVYAHFDNPARRPILVPDHDPGRIYDTLSRGGCEAAVLPRAVYRALQGKRVQDRELLTTTLMPGVTLTAGPRLAPQDKAAIVRALLEGQEGGLLIEGSPGFARAHPADYDGLSRLLNPLWGFAS